MSPLRPVLSLFRMPEQMKADPYGIDAALAERKAARPARQAAAKRGREHRA